MKIKQLGIHIKVKDFSRSLEFYLKFGLEPVFVYGSKDLRDRFPNIPSAPENYNGMTFAVESTLFEIADGHVAIKPDVFKQDVKSSKISLMLDVQSVSVIRKICEENNFEIAKSEVDYPWGTRELVVKDPDGVILVFREKYY